MRKQMRMMKHGKKIMAAGLLVGAMLLVGCGNKASVNMTDERSASKVDLVEPATRNQEMVALTPETESDADRTLVTSNEKYLTLINRENPIPADWKDQVTFDETIDVDGSEALVEEETLRAYGELREALAEEGILIGICSAYRSEEYQQYLIDTYTANFGASYVQQYVAPVGCSEHHSGLALDLSILQEDFVESLEEYDDPELTDFRDSFAEEAYLAEQEAKQAELREQYGDEDTWTRIHNKLADHGFILRYPEGKEDITGYHAEEWHIRYVGDPETAHEIMDGGLTLEEYLGQ